MTYTTGDEVKNAVILTILKFYQINGYEEIVRIERSEFLELSDAEIDAALSNLVKNKLVEVLDDRAIKNDIMSTIYKANNFDGRKIKLKILDGFNEYIKENQLNDCSKRENVKAAFTVTYKHRKLKINEIQIARPNFDSENDYFAMLITDNPNKKITASEFVKFKNSEMIKRFDQIINDLGFKGNIKKLFFPNISAKAVEFRNPVSRKDMKEVGIEDILPADF